MYIARQPIFTRNLKTYGYELLFRNNKDSNCCTYSSSQSATAAVIGGLFENGIEKIVEGKRAFINFDYNFLMSDLVELIGSKTLVIEILENVKIDCVLQNRLAQLKKRNYIIALDDYECNKNSKRAMPYSNIIKYDIQKTPLDSIKQDVKKSIQSNKIILAEKIETKEEFELAKKMNFHLFQGYFFCKPNIISSCTSAKKSSPITYVNILNELKRKEFSYDVIVKIFESDVNLSYRLMKIFEHKNINERFKSLRNVLVKMGKKEIKRWVCVLMLQDISSTKPDELFSISIIRSRFGEYIAKKSIFYEDTDEVFLMLLFSMIDVILDKSMEAAITPLPFSLDIMECLLNKTGKYKNIYLLIIAYEQGDLSEVDLYSKKIGIDSNELFGGYLSAIELEHMIIESLS